MNTLTKMELNENGAKQKRKLQQVLLVLFSKRANQMRF